MEQGVHPEPARTPDSSDRGSPAAGPRDWIPRVALALLAAALLLANLGNAYLWQDEAQTALIARTIGTHGVPHGSDGRNHFSQELGVEVGADGVWRWHTWLSFYVVAASLASFGENAFAARLPFALCGIACVWWAGSLALELWRDRVAAHAAALVLALNVPFLILARQARWYALAALLGLMALTAYSRLDRRGGRAALGLGAAALLLFHTHFLYCATLLAALAAHAALCERQRLRATLGVAAVVTLLCVPWIVWLSGIRLGGDYTGRLLDLGDTSGHALRYLRETWQHWLASGLFLLAVPAAALARGLRGQPVLHVARATWSGVALLCLTAATTIGALSLLNPFPFFRYLAPLGPPAAVLVGLLVAAAWRAWPPLAVAAVAAWAFTGSLRDFAYELTHDFDGPIEGIVLHLQQHARPGDRVAIVNGDMPLKFYTDLRVIGGLTGEDLAEAEGAEWIILRHFNTAPIGREIRRRLRAQISPDRYVRRVIDYPETAFENREDPAVHRYRTSPTPRRVVIWEKRR